MVGDKLVFSSLKVFSSKVDEWMDGFLKAMLAMLSDDEQMKV